LDLLAWLKHAEMDQALVLGAAEAARSRFVTGHRGHRSGRPRHGQCARMHTAPISAKLPAGLHMGTTGDSMHVTAAVLYAVNKPYSIETVELDPPRRGEVLIKVGAAGICRSDLHFQKGEASIAMPAVMGHEGAGTVQSVGEGVSMVKPGDRVILSFVPSCGHCHSCEHGRPPLCDEHARTTGKLYDNTSRLHTLAGQDCAHMGKVACFAEYAVVPEMGCVPAPAS